MRPPGDGLALAASNISNREKLAAVLWEAVPSVNVKPRTLFSPATARTRRESTTLSKWNERKKEKKKRIQSATYANAYAVRVIYCNSHALCVKRILESETSVLLLLYQT